MKNKSMKVKVFVLCIIATILLSGTIVMANPVARDLFFGVTVTIDGENARFSEDSQPFIVDGRVFLPMRAMAELLGFEVDWDPSTNMVSVATYEVDVEPHNIITAEPTVVEPPAVETPVEPAVEAPVAAVNPITSAEITALHTAWGEGLVAISTAYAEGEDYATIAQGVLDTLYGYVDGTVLFKPTVAQEVPFRFTEAAAASYFIGGSINEDTGFALNPWTAVRFGTDGRYIINGETALWMGSVFLTNDVGEEIRVEKSLGLYRDANGDVRIQLHHSSVPFTE